MKVRLFNVYDTLRLEGMKCAENIPPKVLFPQGTQVTTIPKGSTIEISEEDVKKLQDDLDQEGKGVIRTILDYKDNILVITKPENLPEVKKASEEVFRKAQAESEKIVELGKDMIAEKKKYADAVKVFNVALNLLYKQRYEAQTEILLLKEKIKRKNLKISKYRSGETMTMESVAKTMKEFNLFSQKEVDDLIDFHVETTIKSEGVFHEKAAEESEKKIRNRYEIQISQNNVKKLVKLIDPKPAKEIKYAIALMNNMNIATASSYKKYFGIIQKIIQTARITLSEIPREMTEENIRNGLNVIYMRYKNEPFRRPVLIMKYHSKSFEKVMQIKEQSAFENKQLYDENIRMKKKEESYQITAVKLKEHLKRADEVAKEINYGVVLVNKMGMITSQTFKTHKEVVYFIFSATGASPTS